MHCMRKVCPQKGFSQILVLLILLAGIAAGTYLVQQRTNLKPKALEINIQCQDSCDVQKEIGESGCRASPPQAKPFCNLLVQQTYSNCLQYCSSKPSCSNESREEEYYCAYGTRCYNLEIRSTDTACEWQPKPRISVRCESAVPDCGYEPEVFCTTSDGLQPARSSWDGPCTSDNIRVEYSCSEDGTISEYLRRDETCNAAKHPLYCVSYYGRFPLGDSWRGGCYSDGYRVQYKCGPDGSITSDAIEDRVCQVDFSGPVPPLPANPPPIPPPTANGQPIKRGGVTQAIPQLYVGAGCKDKESVWGNWMGSILVEEIQNFGQIPGQCDVPSTGQSKREGAGCKGKESIWGVWDGDKLTEEKKNFGQIPGNCGVTASTAATTGTKTGGTGGTGTSDQKKDSALVSPADWKTEGCKDNPVSPPNTILKWHAFCSKENYGVDPTSEKIITCVTNADCPRNTIETGAKILPAQDLPGKPTTAWCYGFKEGNRCLQLRSVGAKDDDPAFDTPKDLFKIALEKAEKDKTKIPFGGINIGSSVQDLAGSIANSIFNRFKEFRDKLAANRKRFTDGNAKKAADKTKQIVDNNIKTAESCAKASDPVKCVQDLKPANHLAKVGYRLAKYYEIMQGTPNVCVKADLGLKPRLEAKIFNAAGNGTATETRDSRGKQNFQDYRRLFLCSSGLSKSDKIILQWRVHSNSSSDNDDSDKSNSPNMARTDSKYATDLGTNTTGDPNQNHSAPKDLPGGQGDFGVDTLSKFLEKYVKEAESKLGLSSTKP